MSNWRVQVVRQLTTADPGRDYITNVLTFRSDTTPASSIGDAVSAAFTSGGGVYNQSANVWTKVYDHAAPLHSPPVYTKLYSGTPTSGIAPRQLALCLSWYCSLNIKGKRGRIYIGPFQTTDMAEYASSALMSKLIALGGLLHTPGGPDVVHTVHHVASDTFSDVTNYFCNNRWDTMRSRLPKETARQVST